MSFSLWVISHNTPRFTTNSWKFFTVPEYVQSITPQTLTAKLSHLLLAFCGLCYANNCALSCSFYHFMFLHSTRHQYPSSVYWVIHIHSICPVGGLEKSSLIENANFTIWYTPLPMKPTNPDNLLIVVYTVTGTLVYLIPTSYT